MVERELQTGTFFRGFVFYEPRPEQPGYGLAFLNENGSITTYDDGHYHDAATVLEAQNEANTAEALESRIDFNQVIEKFSTISNKIGATLGNIYPKNIDISIVAHEEMMPSDEERDMLIKTYGEYMKNGSSAYFTYKEDGTPHIRLGYAGLENDISEYEVMHTLAHEVGHSLGGYSLTDKKFEEMKAYAFTQLFLRYYTNSDIVEDITQPLSSERVHDVAHSRVMQLVIAGANEEAILAHLTGVNFGEYHKDSWGQMIAARTKFSNTLNLSVYS